MLGCRLAGHADLVPCKPFSAPLPDPKYLLRTYDMPVLHPWHMLLYIQYVQSASSGYAVLNGNFCTQDGRQCVAQGSAEEH